MPITSDSPRRRSCLPSVARRPVLGLALVLWTGWAPPPVAAAERWLRPVPGEASRAFSLGANQFARGQHRGVDLTARAGDHVRSACGGVVVFAGAVPRARRVVTVRCGRWRVTYLPLEAVSVRRGVPVAAGSRLGSVGAGHRGLHVGVRREGRRFGYVDPLPLLQADPPPPVLVRPPGLGPTPIRPSPPAVGRFRPLSAPPEPAPSAPARFPLPAWLGLALLLTGAAGGQTVALRRRRRRTALSAREVVASRLTATTR